MFIEIKPLDTLFFKDGKPFSMGEETWVDGIFPPYPSTIYGALRTLYFSNQSNEIVKAGEADDPTKNLKIKGMFLKSGDVFLFPVPFDVVKEKKGKEKVFVLHLKNKPYFFSNYPFSKILTTERKAESIKEGFFTELDFEDYLNANDEFYLNLKNYIKSEPKIGIARDNFTHSSAEGKLYRVDMKRLDNLSIVVEFEGLEISEEGLLKLGAEGKGAEYKKFEGEKINFPDIDRNNKYFKLVLTTPAIFEKGWLPVWIDEKTLEGNYKELRLKLIATAIGKPILIGGFDMKNRMPKPAYKAVPAGSVYYFELQEGSIENLKRYYHGKTISEVYPEQGFGIVFVGRIGC